MEVELKGESFIICRNGKPVAKIIPHTPPQRMSYHPVLSKIKIKYDPTEALSSEEWGETGSSSPQRSSKTPPR
jgi:antitoxin (DNA-binding transcriptional repressor) of toxin-antitoxin stability system